jgi:outer membrane protein TolC
MFRGDHRLKTTWLASAALCGLALAAPHSRAQEQQPQREQQQQEQTVTRLDSVPVFGSARPADAGQKQPRQVAAAVPQATPTPAQTPAPAPAATPAPAAQPTPEVLPTPQLAPTPQVGPTPAAPPEVSPTTRTNQPPTLMPPPSELPVGRSSQQPALPPVPPASLVSPAPELKIEVPPVAEGFRATPLGLPEFGRVGVDVTEQRPLALSEAIALALENAKDIEVARANVRAAEFDLTAARGVFDPRFVSQSFYERVETPAASFLAGASGGSVTQTNLFGSLRLEGLTPAGGGNYRFDLSSGRQTSDNFFTALNPQYPSGFSFTYNQPLLRGRRFDQNRRLVEIAKKNLSLTDAQFRQRAIETITAVQRAYWDLVFALRNLQVQRDTVRDARAQLEHNRRLVTEGVLAPIDVVAAEAQVSNFEQSVYAALDEVGRAENSLKNLIAENRRSEVWRVAIVPTDTVDAERPPAVTLEEAMESALRARPELQQSDVALAINELDERLAREQTRPQVDLFGTYGAVGVAGALDPARATNPFTASSEQLRQQINLLTQRVNENLPGQQLPLLPTPPVQTIPEQLVGGVGQSLTNLAANRFNNFRVGVTLNLPVGNRTAEAQLGRTLVERDRLRTQREQLEQLIQVDVRNALQLARTAEARLRSASVSRAASEQQYASERRKFDAGQSTFFLVLERQTALAAARAAELRAQTELNKALAELQRATGNSLEANQVRVRAR